MVNSLDLENNLIKAGFSIIYPDLLTVQQQIDVFSNAECIVGASGAGLFNAIFCKPETKLLDIESEQHWIYAHVSLFSSFRLKFGVNWAKPENDKIAHGPYNVDVGSIMDNIDLLNNS